MRDKRMTTLLTIMVVVLMGSSAKAATTQYVDIDTVVIIYRHFFFSDSIRMDLSAADVQTIKDDVERVREFVWRASNLKCHMNILEYLEIDRPLTLAQLRAHPNSSYMLHFRRESGQTTSVADDMADAGYLDGDVTITIALWPLQQSNDPRIRNRYGGQEWGPMTPNGLLGDCAYISVPMSSGAAKPLERYGVINHEYEHALDQLLKFASPSREDSMTNPDRPKEYVGMQDCGEHFKFKNLDDVPLSHWHDIVDPKWARTQVATDDDSDGVPDTGDLPITEAILGTSTSSSDSDGDGLRDFDELQATFHGASDPAVADTDGDGINDGADAFPLYDYESRIWKTAGVTVDGMISRGEYTFVANCNGTQAEHSYDFYMAWDDNTLYVAADVTDDQLNGGWRAPTTLDGLQVQIDGDWNGFRYNGEYNYRIIINPEPGDSGGAQVTADRWAADGTWYSLATDDVDAVYSVNATGYIFEMKIPASVFENNIHYNLDKTLRMRIAAKDRDDLGDPRWDLLQGGGEGFEAFADFTLVDAPTLYYVNGATGDDAWAGRAAFELGRTVACGLH